MLPALNKIGKITKQGADIWRPFIFSVRIGDVMTAQNNQFFSELNASRNLRRLRIKKILVNQTVYDIGTGFEVDRNLYSTRFYFLFNSVVTPIGNERIGVTDSGVELWPNFYFLDGENNLDLEIDANGYIAGGNLFEIQVETRLGVAFANKAYQSFIQIIAEYQ